MLSCHHISVINNHDVEVNLWITYVYWLKNGTVTVFKCHVCHIIIHICMYSYLSWVFYCKYLGQLTWVSQKLSFTVSTLLSWKLQWDRSDLSHSGMWFAWVNHPKFSLKGGMCQDCGIYFYCIKKGFMISNLNIISVSDCSILERFCAEMMWRLVLVSGCSLGETSTAMTCDDGDPRCKCLLAKSTLNREVQRNWYLFHLISTVEDRFTHFLQQISPLQDVVNCRAFTICWSATDKWKIPDKLQTCEAWFRGDEV